MSTCLITGATGMVGSELVAQALQNGRQIAVLARDLGPLPACDRFPDPVRVLRGDVRQSDLGLSPPDLDWLTEECVEVLHLAARVSFQADPRTSEPYLTNIDGTRHLLNVCRKCNVSRLGYVSTAYVCGDRSDKVAQSELEAGQGFHNDYERSKFVAERLVAESTWLRRATVFRPSVVVGHSATGATTAFHGLYSVMQAAWLFEPEVRVKFLKQAGVDPDCAINLVPVDWVADTIWRCWDAGSDGYSVYHLTHPEPVTLRRIIHALDQTGSGGASLAYVDPDVLGEVVGPLRGYLREHPRFESSVPKEPPAMDDDVLANICRYAVTQNFRSRRTGIDLTRLLGALPAVDLPPVLKLEFEDGGQAYLGSTGNGLCRVAEGPSPVTAFATRSVFDELLSRGLDLNSAVFSGRLVLEAESEVIPDAMTALGLLIEHLGVSA